MRSHLITKTLIVGDVAIGSFDNEVAILAIPKLDTVGVVGAFNATVKLGSSGQQRKLSEFLIGALG